jgi:Cytochrome C biogenesis protein transmembrane region
VASGSLVVAAAVSVAAGTVGFASPCVLPLVPGYLAFVSGLSGADLADQVEGRRPARGAVVAGAGLFVLGFAAFFTLIGGRSARSGRSWSSSGDCSAAPAASWSPRSACSCSASGGRGGWSANGAPSGWSPAAGCSPRSRSAWSSGQDGRRASARRLPPSSR